MARSSVCIAITAIVVVGSLSISDAVLSQAGSVTFESLDKNSDGKLSLTEASENDGLFVAFKSLDKNKDGELSKEEFAAYQKGGAGA